jgi:hypothetical protein
MIGEVECFFCMMPIETGELIYEHEGNYSHKDCYDREGMEYPDEPAGDIEGPDGGDDE